MSSADDGGRSFDAVLDVSESDGDASAAACLDGSPASELADCSSRVCVSAAASAAPCETASSGGVRDGPEESGAADGTGNNDDDGAAANAGEAASVFGEGRVRCKAALGVGIGLDARCVEASALLPDGGRCTRLEGRCVGAAGAGADAAGAAASKSSRLLLTELPAAASGCIFDGSEPRRIPSARWAQKEEAQASGMDESESESGARRASDGDSDGGSS